MLWKRLTDVEHVMHVQKALILCDYLIRNGADRFIKDVKSRSRDIAELTKYKFYNDENRDIAGEARSKAQQIYAMLQDEDKLYEERQKAQQLRESNVTRGFGSNDYDYVAPNDSRRSNFESENIERNQHRSEWSDEKPRKSINQSAEKEAANSATTANEEVKKKKKKKKPVEEDHGQSGQAAAPSFGFDDSKDPFSSSPPLNRATSSAHDPFAPSTFAIGYTEKPVSEHPDPFGSTSPASGGSIAAASADGEKKKSRKKKGKEAANETAGAASAAYTNHVRSLDSTAFSAFPPSQPGQPSRSSAASDPFSAFDDSAPVSYDLTGFNPNSNPHPVDPHTDFLTGSAGPVESDLASAFASKALLDDPELAPQRIEQHTVAAAAGSAASAPVSSSSGSSSLDVWAIGTQFTNIDNIHKSVEQKKAMPKEEISMSMMKSMQPVGNHHADRNENKIQPSFNSFPQMSLGPMPVQTVPAMQSMPVTMPLSMPVPAVMSGVPMPMMMPVASVPAAQPMLGMPMPVVYPYGAPGAAPVQVPVGMPGSAAPGMDPFAASNSPNGNYRKSAMNSNGKPIIFDPVPERRSNATAAPQQPSGPSGPNWNRR